jgi:hypothetical protein
MMLNDWLAVARKKGQRVCQDSDRLARTDKLFDETIVRTHRLTLVGAHEAELPDVERFDYEEGVLLSIEWYDKSAGWHLWVGVNRRRGHRPCVTLDFSGDADAGSYSTTDPTDTDIAKALYDYFEAWKDDHADP